MCVTDALTDCAQAAAFSVTELVPTPALLGVGSKTGGCRFDSWPVSVT
jgi:hypothetical protein